MKVEIICQKCASVVSSFETDDIHRAEVAMLAAHVNPPHYSPHPIAILVDGNPLPTGDAELVMECIEPGCRSDERVHTYRIPREMIVLAGLNFHSIHEGHLLRMHYDGKLIAPIATVI